MADLLQEGAGQAQALGIGEVEVGLLDVRAPVARGHREQPGRGLQAVGEVERIR